MKQTEKMSSGKQKDTTEALICANYNNAPDALIEILHDVQIACGYIREPAFEIIAHALNLSRAEVYGVVSFYEDFKTEKPAEKTLKICRGEACQSMGANKLLERGKAAAEHVPVRIETLYCLGNCALAPALINADRLHGRMNEEKLARLMAQMTSGKSESEGSDK